MRVMQIGGVPECVCGSRAFDTQVARVWPGWIDYRLTCWACRSVMVHREPDYVPSVQSVEAWSDD